MFQSRDGQDKVERIIRKWQGLGVSSYGRVPVQNINVEIFKARVLIVSKIKSFGTELFLEFVSK